MTYFVALMPATMSTSTESVCYFMKYKHSNWNVPDLQIKKLAYVVENTQDKKPIQ
jgi:hypothetical protein